MKTVQIKGANGSGKTTIIKDLLSLSRDIELIQWRPKYTVATVMHDLKWMVIGEYKFDSKMGGMDLIDTATDVRRAIVQCTRLYPNYRGVIVEGMLLSVTKWKYYDLQMTLYKRYGHVPYVVILKSTVENCLQRIKDRGTMRKEGIKVANIQDKVTKTIAHGKCYDKRFTRWIEVDETPRDEMLWNFLVCIGEERLWDEAM